MLPITRANLDNFCCVCLLDIRPSVFSQKVYDVRKELNLSKVLKLTAHMTILRNPFNQKYINDYCRKICEVCFIKMQYSYTFRERIIASTATLKELLESNDLSEKDIENLKFFCRVCLNRQTALKDSKRIEVMHINWMKDCSGIRFTSFIDNESFRIKEGTNINEIAIVDDKHFPKHLCLCCFKKLRNVDEFRKSATQSFEYMIYVMGDAIIQEDQLMTTEFINFKQNNLENINQRNCNDPTIEYFNIQDTEQGSSAAGLLHSSNYTCNTAPAINSIEITNMLHFDDNICQYSDNDVDDIIINFSESSDSTDSNNKNIFRKATDEKSKQVHFNEMSFKNSEEKNTDTDIEIKSENPVKDELPPPSNPRRRCRKSLKNLKENTDNVKVNSNTIAEVNNDKITLVCEKCSKEFSSKRSLRKHKNFVHDFDSSKMLECLTCFQKFKRKSHMDAHIKAVHEKQRPFKCTHCAKTFSSKSTRRGHELSHTEDFPFVCNFCGKGFRRSNQLKIHLDIHTTTPELLCPICKRSQKSKTDLEDHLKTHSDKRTQCPHCGKFFTRNSHLIDHQNAVHFKLRPFKCEFCELAFGDRKSRRSHEKCHTEDRPFKCSICLMGFKSKIGLSKHIKDNGHNP